MDDFHLLSGSLLLSGFFVRFGLRNVAILGSEDGADRECEEKEVTPPEEEKGFVGDGE